MRFVIFGAGAIGSGIGGHLHRTGHDALLVGRAAHVERIQQQGLRLVTAQQTLTLPVPAVSQMRDIHFTDDDVLLLCVKSQDTERALLEIRAAGANPDRLPIVCCQNSITNEPAAARYFARIYGAMIVVPGVFLEPGIVYNPGQDNAGFIEIGNFPAGCDALAEEIVHALQLATYAAYVNASVMTAKAGKLFGNLSNALAAITDGRGERDAYHARLQAEAEACFEAAGIAYEPADDFERRAHEHMRLSELPPGIRNLGSTWQSLQRGLDSIEADFLNGEIVRLGRLHGVATPYNQVLQTVATQMAAHAEKPGKFTVAELQEMANARA